MVSSNQDQIPHDPALSSQGPTYRLTIDEMQSHLSDIGKPLYAMKSEKLSSTEESAEQQQQQNHVQTSYATSSAGDVPHLHGPLSVSGSLCRKAMQEVWHEVSQQGEQGDSHGPFDTTLEDFLARAAAAANYEGQGDVVLMDPQPFMAEVLDPLVQQRAAELLHYQLAASQHTQQQKKMSVFHETGIPTFNDAVLLGDYIESKQKGTSIMPVVPMAMVKSALADTQATGMMELKQSDGPLDKNYERKQKRMIKNRESAARSRAKKQAHINQLEKQVVELKQMNERLKRQNEVYLQMHTLPPKRACKLRRTRSALF